MTLHVTTSPIGLESDQLSPTVRIGMPHLSLSGLSENWLLKECGHRHWFLLAAAAGDMVPDFRDAAGDKVYAVFRAVSIRNACFDAVKENDVIQFSSKLSRVSRSQFESSHYLTCRDRQIAQIDMISSFVKRTVAGVNRSVARVDIDAFPFAGQSLSSTLAERASAFGKGVWIEHQGFSQNSSRFETETVICPNPSLDFNGAGFVYFASFPALVDRAEWETLDSRSSLITASRDVFYLGNIEPGEKVVVRFENVRRRSDGLSHWTTLRRADDTKIAAIFTTRSLSRY